MVRGDHNAEPRIACFATQGSTSQDENRLKALLDELAPHVLPFDRSRRFRGALTLVRRIRALDPEIVVMEGTGITGGVSLLISRLIDGRPYVVSSGDAIGPFLSSVSRPLGLAGALYERALCRGSAGFIGWSPYLVGRALTLGAPRAMTAPNWSPRALATNGTAAREQLGIPPDALVFGIVGSLNWTPRYEYCYGLELVRAALMTEREDLRVLIVGDGDGRERLRRLAGKRADRSILLPGAVGHGAVGEYLAAMDVASLPQTVDAVGSFRYTTKISEYLAARRPVVTGQIPLSYDLDGGWLWRLPGDAPWDPHYLAALADLMATLSREEARRRQPSDEHASLFDEKRQRRQVTQFVLDVLAREEQRPRSKHTRFGSRQQRRGPAPI